MIDDLIPTENQREIQDAWRKVQEADRQYQEAEPPYIDAAIYSLYAAQKSYEAAIMRAFRWSHEDLQRVLERAKSPGTAMCECEWAG